MSNLATVSNNQLAANDFEIPRGYICTLDITSIDGKMQLATALNGAITMKDRVGEPLPVVDIVTTQGVRARTGEECVNTHLILEDGTVLFSQSDGIARSVKVIVALFTDPNTNKFVSPLSQGIALMVKEQELPNGNTLKTIIPVKRG